MTLDDYSDLKQDIFSDGNSYFQSLIHDIQEAQHCVDLETYIFQNDNLGKEIAEALIQASERGVKIRVLVDGAGTPTWGNNFTKKLERAGVQTRIFHPFPWRVWHWSRSYVRAPFLLKAIYLLLKINSRNHRKVCVIDQKIAYVGSFNISKVHLSHAQGGDDWRDTGVKLTGIPLQELTHAFTAAWNHIPIQERLHRLFRPINDNPIIRLNNTRHLRRGLYKNLLHRLRRCKTRIVMVNAYFVPDHFLLKRLKDAAQKGLDVRIILSRKSDVVFMPWASATFYENLLKAGVRIFEYLPSMLHSKTLILDDWIIVGSSNLNHRSLLHDLEVDINIRTPEAKKTIERLYEEDIMNSQEINLDNWQKRPFFQRVMGKLLLYVKYWI